MTEIADRVAALERDRDAQRALIDDLHYQVSLLMKSNREVSSRMSTYDGRATYNGTVAIGPKSASQEWVWIDAHTSDIASGAFHSKSIREVVFSPQSSVRAIGYSAFYGCGQLRRVCVPQSVVIIGGCGFQCSGLSEILFANDALLHTIEQYAFYATQLKAVALPAAVTSLGGHCFHWCAKLVSFQFAAKSKLVEIGACAFSGCSSLRSIQFPAGVPEVPKWCFSDCRALVSVTFEGTSMVAILEGAFRNCVALKRVELPASLRVLGGNANPVALPREDGAFEGCVSLEQVTAAGGCAVAEIGAKCFAGCVRLRHFFPTWRLAMLGGSAFAGCTALAALPMGQMEQIGEGALCGCTAVTEIELPATLKFVGARAFYNCAALSTVRFTGGRLDLLADEAFARCPLLRSVELPAVPKALSPNAFAASCSVNMPDASIG